MTSIIEKHESPVVEDDDEPSESPVADDEDDDMWKQTWKGIYWVKSSNKNQQSEKLIQQITDYILCMCAQYLG